MAILKPQRDSNLELYRIIGMLLIVAHHMVVNSGLLATDSPIFSNPNSIKTFFIWILGAWGKTGINCFMLITGYFMCKSDISPRKAVKLISQIYFYNIVFFIIFVIAGYESISPIRIVKLLMPIWNLDHNFTSCFIVFWLCIPFLNHFIHNINENQHRWLLVLMITCYTILGTIPTFKVTFNYVTWFCILYFISSYIRLYPKDIYRNTKYWLMATLISLTIGIISIVSMLYILPSYSPYFFIADSNKILAVALGLSSFMYFKNIKIKYNKTINTIASTTFGILLIHANSNAMRKWLWHDVVNCVGNYDHSYMPLYFISCLLIIFITCSLIDFLRIKLLEKPFLLWWDNKIECRVISLFKKITKE